MAAAGLFIGLRVASCAGSGDPDTDACPDACPEDDEVEFECSYSDPQTGDKGVGGSVCVASFGAADFECAVLCNIEFGNGPSDNVCGVEDIQAMAVQCEDAATGTGSGSGSSGGSGGMGETDFVVNCATWDPSSHVTYDSQSDVYDVDEDFFADLLDNTFYLLQCDGARIYRPSAGAAFEWRDISPRELAAELGFENGDEIVSINGQEILDVDDAVQVARSEAWETSFEVVVQRNAQKKELQYEVVSNP